MAGPIPNTPELRRRVQAARAYAGNLSLDEFARRLGVGRQTLVRIENGERGEVKEMELRQMATVASVPIEFFTADFERLGTAPPSIAERLAAIEGALRISQPEDDRAEVERDLEDRARRSGTPADDSAREERARRAEDR